MAATTSPAKSPARPLRGASIIQSIKNAGVETVVALPDIVTCDGVLWPIARDPDLRLVPVCKEDEGVSICAAPVLLRSSIRSSHPAPGIPGFDQRDSGNWRSNTICPVVMILGLQGMESDRTPSQSDKLSVRIVEPICEAMELDYAILYDESDVAVVEPMIAKGVRAVKTRRHPHCQIPGVTNEMMKRDQALRVLADHYPDGIVVPVYQSAFDWLGIRPHPLNYLCTGRDGASILAWPGTGTGRSQRKGGHPRRRRKVC